MSTPTPRAIPPPHPPSGALGPAKLFAAVVGDSLREEDSSRRRRCSDAVCLRARGLGHPVPLRLAARLHPPSAVGHAGVCYRAYALRYRGVLCVQDFVLFGCMESSHRT